MPARTSLGRVVQCAVVLDPLEIAAGRPEVMGEELAKVPLAQHNLNLWSHFRAIPREPLLIPALNTSRRVFIAGATFNSHQMRLQSALGP